MRFFLLNRSRELRLGLTRKERSRGRHGLHPLVELDRVLDPGLVEVIEDKLDLRGLALVLPAS